MEREPPLGWLGILAPERTSGLHPFGEQTRFLADLSAAAAAGRVAAYVFTPATAVDRDGRSLTGWRYRCDREDWLPGRFPIPDLCYDRVLRPHGGAYRRISAWLARSSAIRCLNSPLRGKWRVYQSLAAAGSLAPYLPFARLYRGSGTLHDMVDRFPCLYVKPVYGAGGRGILCIQRLISGFLCRFSGQRPPRPAVAPSLAALTRLVETWVKGRVYLIQQGFPLFLPDGRPWDLWALAQKDERERWSVSGVVPRTGARGGAAASVGAGGPACPAFAHPGQRLPGTGAEAGGASGQVPQVQAALQHLLPTAAASLEAGCGPMVELGFTIGVDRAGRPWLLDASTRPDREVFVRGGLPEAYQRSVEQLAAAARRLLAPGLRDQAGR